MGSRRTRLSDFTFTFHFHALEKEMATHSNVLAWRIPWTEEPGGLLSMGSHRVGHDWSDLAAAAAAVYLLSWFCLWFPTCAYVKIYQIILCGSFLFWLRGVFVAVHGLCCSTKCGILVSGPRIKPVSSPALPSRFLTTGPLRRSPV